VENEEKEKLGKDAPKAKELDELQRNQAQTAREKELRKAKKLEKAAAREARRTPKDSKKKARVRDRTVAREIKILNGGEAGGSEADASAATALIDLAWQ